MTHGACRALRAGAGATARERSHHAVVDLETGAQVELTHIDKLDLETAKRLDALGIVHAPNVLRIVAVVGEWGGVPVLDRVRRWLRR